MPLELIADRPGHAILNEYDEPALEANQVRIKSLFSSVKHGTELRSRIKGHSLIFELSNSSKPVAASNSPFVTRFASLLTPDSLPI